MKRRQVIENILSDAGRAVKDEESERIKVTIHIPEKMNETSRRLKINRIYDILSPDTPR